MSVIIKDFDKPSDCDYCTLQDDGYCNVLLSYINVEHGIDTRCPLVEIKDMTDEEFDSILARLMADRKTEPKESEQMAKKPKTLKEIAIELLEKYEASETTAIWEYSPNIRLSEEMLKKEVAKYRKMIDKADRKTENSSEIPNNCEECKHWSDIEDGCADRHGCRTTTEDCSMVDKDINVRSKDEPQTEMPRCSVNGTPFDECGFCEYFNCDTCKCEADVPQAERSE